MGYVALQKYITHLYTTRSTNSTIWIDDAGQAQGRYFNSTLTSVFQPLRSSLDLQIVGYQGLARSYSPLQENAQGLSLWRLLDHAANDEESIELDRLCRLLHAINFYRQPQAFGQDVYVNVHSRLLAAIQNNHGAAFRKILATLELPHQHIILELPASLPNQRWILNHVADNYHRNGFRIAVNLTTLEQGLSVVQQRQVHAIKIDSVNCQDFAMLSQLLDAAQETATAVIIKRLDSERLLNALQQFTRSTHHELYLQGFVLDKPHSSLFSAPVKSLQRGDCTKCHSA